MKTFIIVLGKGVFDIKPRNYMKVIDGESITYHNFKAKKHSWATKYGPYNTIKEHAGHCFSYNVGEKSLQISEVRELTNITADRGRILTGCNL